MLDFFTRDGWLLLAARTVRGISYGFVSVLLATYLTTLRADETTSGVVLGVAMLSGAALNIAASRYADRIGRRRFLGLSGAIMCGSGLVLALTGSIEGALAAALIGGLTPTAMEIGPFLSVEQAILPQASAPDRRPDAYAWYNLVGSLAAAFGALFTGLAGAFSLAFGGDPLAGYHAMFAWYAVAGVASCLLSLRLSDAVELKDPAPGPGKPTLSPEGRAAVRRMTALFGVDAFAGGMIIRTFTAYWFAIRFSPTIEVLGLVFFAANAASAVSYLPAAKLAHRLGLVKTMVYTHIPSNILLVAMAFSPTFEFAVVLFVARMSISQMDVAPRQQFVVSVVAPYERTAAAGITNTARNLAQAGGPFVIGPVVLATMIGGPFVLAGLLKLAYDVSLLRAFGATKVGAHDS